MKKNRYGLRYIEENTGIIIVKDGVGEFYPTVFLATQIRKSFNTIVAEAHTIVSFYNFFDQIELDLEERLKNGQYLNRLEICELVEFFKFKKSNPKEVVSENTRNTRIDRTVKYMTWLGSSFNSKLNYGPIKTDREFNLKEMCNNLKNLVTTDKNSFNYQFQKPKSLSDTDLRTIEKYLHPKSPFLDGKYKENVLRNWIIYKLFISYGIRRGELLRIKIGIDTVRGKKKQSLNLRDGNFTILRNPDDPLETRKYRPQVKTLERTFKLSDDLIYLINDYIKIRSKLGVGRKHNFLFCVHYGQHKGNPLSTEALGRIFRELREKHKDINPNFTPHALRHTFFNKLAKRMEDYVVTDEGKEILKRKEQTAEGFMKGVLDNLGGWSPRSETAYLYISDHTKEAAEKLTADQNDELSKIHIKSLEKFL